MPVYAYTCRACGTPLEVHQEFTDAALTECPACGGALRKQYGSIGVTFNGSGFYRTDSRAGSGEGKAETKPAKSEGAAAAKTDASSSTATTASKPAAAAASSTGS